MTKNYLFKAVLSMLSILLVSILPVNGQIDYALNEDFESGKIPSEWSQYHEVGNTDWIVEQGGEFPDGSAGGSWRATLRNTTGQTQGFRTKLISPQMDLRSVYQPILIFSHAQDHYLSDVDVLKVYYRLSETLPWIELEEYTNRIRDWKSDTIRLVDYMSVDTYQIAFEGTDKFGRGIVLDDIQIRPMPTCDIPVIRTGTEVTSTSFSLLWNGSFDTENFQLRISKTPLDDPDDIDEDTEIVLDTIVPLSFQCLIENLDVNTMFYCYIKAFCPGEASGWSEAYQYRTQAVVTLPYDEPFNLPFNRNIKTQLATWTWGNSWVESGSTTLAPYINTDTEEGLNRTYFSRSSTTCVVFSSGSISSPIQGGAWSYIASPEIRGIESLNEVQVSCWGTVYRSIGDEYASSLIVGAMTDPEDINTFYPIDTITVKKTEFYQEFQISFDKYTGPGKHVAFVSQFDKANLFYLDDVLIELIGDCPKAGGLSANYVYPTSAEITWKEVSGASGYNVLITSKSVADPANPGADLVYRTGSPVSANVCIIPDNTLQPFTRYYAYVQSECGGSPGLWSSEYTFLTPFSGEVPLYYTFEPTLEETYTVGRGSNEVVSVGLYGNSAYSGYIPYNFKPVGTTSTPYSFEGEYSLKVTGMTNLQTYVTFPAVDDLSKMRITGYKFLNPLSATDPREALIDVGVLLHIDDIYTFEKVETITVGTTWEYFAVNFDKYTGIGKNIAFYISEENNSSVTVLSYFDNITIEEIPGCDYPLNQSVVPGETTAQFNWDAAGEADQYRLIVSPKPIADFTDLASMDLAVDTIVDTNSCLAGGLLPDKVRYYYAIQSLCGSDESGWTQPMSFETLCSTRNSLPYTEDFEDYTGSNLIEEIPLCWNTIFRKYSSQYSTTYNPYIYNSTTGYAYSGSKSLNLSMSTSSSENRQSYVALPGMDVDSVGELQISFKYRMGSNVARVEVGVLENLEDTSTFVIVELIGPTTATTIWHEATVRLNSYTGKGQHIMLRTPNVTGSGSYSVYIDDIEVDYIKDCIKPQNLAISDIEPTSAVLSWDVGNEETKWHLLVLKNNVKPDETTAVDIQWEEIITQNPYPLGNLAINKEYHYYLRSICGNDTTDWTMNPATFRTGCEARTIDVMGVETFEDGETDFACWVTGLKTGTTLAQAISTPLDAALGRRLYFNMTLTRDEAFAIMPEIKIDSIKDLQVTFDLYAIDNALTNEKGIVVGVVVDPEDSQTLTFAPIDTVRVSALGDYDRKFTVRFDKYNGNPMDSTEHGKYVMFSSPFGTTTTNLVYIDNIYFDTISPCPEPIKIWAEDITIDAAKVVWNKEDVDSYRVVVSETRLSNEELDAGTFTAKENQLVTDTVLPLSGLDALTKYYVYIQSNCSPSEKGPWSNERVFTTLCPPAHEMPYIENFDSYGAATYITPSCWSTYYGTATTSALNYPNCNASYNNTPDGTASLYMYTANTAGYYCLAVSPRLAVQNDISNYQVSFDVLQTVVTTTRPKMIIGLAKEHTNVINDILPIDTICIPDDFEGALQSEWYQYRFDLSNLSGTNDIDEYKHIAFLVVRDLNLSATGATVAAGLYLDNVVVEEIPSCKTPINLGSMNELAYSFVATWVDNIGSAWNVEYGDKGFTLGTGTAITADKESALISGLDPQTDYDFYVQADCGTDGKSEWAGPFTATTLCLLPPEGAEFGFEEEEGYYYSSYSTSNKLPACWILGHDTLHSASIPYSVMSSSSYSYSRTGDYALRLFTSSTYPDKAYAIMPEVDADLDTMQLRFSVRAIYTIPSDQSLPTTYNYVSSGNPHVYVGTVDNPHDFDTFEELAKISLSRWANNDTAKAENNFMWEDFILPLAGAKGKYVTFYVSFDESWKVREYHTFIDDVAIERETACAAVSDVRLDNYNDDVSTAELSWKVRGTLNTGWSVRILTEEADLDAIAGMDPSEFVYTDDLSSSDPVLLNNIEPGTMYYVYIRSICAEGESEWQLTEVFAPCLPVELPVTYTFEEESVQRIMGSADVFAPQCWTVGIKKGASQAANLPHKFPDTGTYTYSRADGGSMEHALRFTTTVPSASASNNSATHINGSYAIMPQFIGNKDTLQVRFHARSAYHRNTLQPGAGYQILGPAGASATRSIKVGMVSSPDDISSFDEIGTYQTDVLTNSMYANEENNWLFNEFIVPLAGAEGNYVAFLSEFTASNLIYIDDVSLEKLGACLTPTNFTVDSITSETANFEWKVNGTNGVGWVIGIASDSEMGNILFESPASSEYKHTVRGLSANTKYYAAVKQLCEDGDESSESDWSRVIEFTTARKVVYDETFSVATNTPDGWLKQSAKFEGDIVTGLKHNSNLKAGWLYTSSSYGLPGGHLKCIVSSSNSYWAATPTIHLTENADTWLVFDLAYTMQNSPYPIQDNGLAGDTTRFMVIISDDNGESWKLENATVWNNDGTGKYVLNNVSATGEQVQINLTPYTGKLIKVAFYVQTIQKATGNNDIHIDNIHINRVVESSYEDYLCAGHDYTDRGFDIRYDEMRLGENSYTSTNLSHNNSVADSILNLTLYVTDFARTVIDDAEVCEGKTYTEYGFNVKGEGEFKQKLSCFASECDSVVILNLSNIPAERETISETICQGQSYTFNGKDYNRTDVYVDTIPSLVTGCDSIVTLVLTVNAILRNQLEETICFGSTYDFNGKELSATDTYLDTVKIDGCDCEVELALTVREDLRTEFYETVCPGEEYEGHGFEGVPPISGTYPRPIYTVPHGCDSTVTLHLTVLDGDTTRREETIKQSRLPFEYHGKLYEAGTPVGTYADTTVVQSSSGECESVLIAILHIEADDVPDGLWSVNADGLTIIPTVIEKGESVQIIYDLSSSAGLKVEVYDMTGRCVYTQHPTVEPIEINAFPNSGMYLIRTISAQGDLHHGRVIVK